MPVDQEDGISRLLDHRPVALLTCFERLLGPLALGYIPACAHDPYDLPVTVSQGHLGGRVPRTVALLVHAGFFLTDQRPARTDNLMLVGAVLLGQLPGVEVEVRLPGNLL